MFTEEKLLQTFENTIPFDSRHMMKVFANQNYFVASFISFLIKTNDIQYVRKAFEYLKTWYLNHIETELTGNEDVNFEFQDDKNFQEWQKVENYTLTDFENYIKCKKQ